MLLNLLLVGLLVGVIAGTVSAGDAVVGSNTQGGGFGAWSTGDRGAPRIAVQWGLAFRPGVDLYWPASWA